MATLRQYFDTDFNHILSVHKTIRIDTLNCESEIIGRIHLDFNANCKFISYFIPESVNTLGICEALIRDHQKLADELANVAKINAGYIKPGYGSLMQPDYDNFEHSEIIDTSELKFTGRVFIYSETNLVEGNKATLLNFAMKENTATIFRSQNYVEAKSQFEKPLAFISHDSRDKDKVARGLALQLSKMMCPVWYDEYSLRVGTSLRESIEKGIRECKKCILVLSKNFLSNTGWTKVEFESVFARELLEKESIILSIWVDVEAKEVYEYCASLPGRVAIPWNLGVEEVARRLYREITA